MKWIFGKEHGRLWCLYVEDGTVALKEILKDTEGCVWCKKIKISSVPAKSPKTT